MNNETPKTNTAAYNGHADLLRIARQMESALRKIQAGDEPDPHALSWGRRDLSREELMAIAGECISSA